MFAPTSSQDKGITSQDNRDTSVLSGQVFTKSEANCRDTQRVLVGHLKGIAINPEAVQVEDFATVLDECIAYGAGVEGNSGPFERPPMFRQRYCEAAAQLTSEQIRGRISPISSVPNTVASINSVLTSIRNDRNYGVMRKIDTTAGSQPARQLSVNIVNAFFDKLCLMIAEPAKCEDILVDFKRHVTRLKDTNFIR